MKYPKTLERTLFIILLAILLALFIICFCKSQSGHDCYEMYRDDHVVVERCAKCGEERFYNPY